MEGVVVLEACSLVGTLSLANWIVLYDDGNIIDGKWTVGLPENIPVTLSLKVGCWHVVPNVNGHDTLLPFKPPSKPPVQKPANRPSSAAKPLIGKGSQQRRQPQNPRASFGRGRNRSHAQTFTRLTRFEICKKLIDAWSAERTRRKLGRGMKRAVRVIPSQISCRSRRILRRLDKKLPDNFDAYVQAALKEVKRQETIATRKASPKASKSSLKSCPNWWAVQPTDSVQPDRLVGQRLDNPRQRRQSIHYGVREFGMGAHQLNGLALRMAA